MLRHNRYRLILGSLLITLVVTNHDVLAENRAGLSFKTNKTSSRASYRPYRKITRFFNVDNYLGIKLKAAKNLEKVGKEIVNSIQDIHMEYENRLQSEPVDFDITISLMNPDDFYKMPEVPSWTNAIYYKGEITIPISLNNLDVDNVIRSVRHEYIHALISAKSGNKCPGWIDEGLAQLSEGTPHPSLKKSLLRWTINHPLIPLSELQGGFTELAGSKVAPAYAQSLYGVQLLLKKNGYSALGRYLLKLKRGINENVAFISTFGITKSEVMKQLMSKIRGY